MNIIEQITTSGRVGVELAIYYLMPITVVIGGLMKVAESKGVLIWISKKVSPITQIIGIPGLSLIAIFKLTFVSSVAPLPSLSKLEQSESDERKVAASLAMILTMTQGNIAFPMVAYGLDIKVLLLSSLIGGIIAAAFTFHFFTRQLPIKTHTALLFEPNNTQSNQGIVQSLSSGGLEGMKIAINMIPMLIIALFFLAVLKDLHVIDFLTAAISPIFAFIQLPEATILPLITKFIAGGTAYMAIMIEQLQQGHISIREMNMIAGIASNPFDIVGIAIFTAIGSRTGSIIKYAVYGSLLGMLIRAVIHIYWFQ